MVTKKNYFALILCALTLFVTTISCSDNDEDLELQKTYFVASKKVDCTGVSAQKCFLVKENANDDWEYFYDSIIGFDYEEGFEYQILVSERNIENPPQDASSIETTLIRIISKVEKESDID